MRPSLLSTNAFRPMSPPNAAPSGHASARARSRGQILVLFVGATVLFVLLCGVVVDIAYYWVGSLQAQRAADAAALAGAVYLPGDRTTAYAAAQASATQNGYTTGGTTAVTPTQDTADPRQLDVAINTRVGTFFSRIVGITSWPINVTAKGVYVLPVPMGSPDAYYGVGNYSVNGTTTTPYTQSSVPGYTSSPVNGAWTTPNNAWTTAASYTTSSTNGQQQAWTGLNIPAISGTTAIDSITVSFSAKVSTASTACTVKADLSWNNGGNWTNSGEVSANLTTAATPYQLGAGLPTSAWDSGHTFAVGDFTNGSFRVRLTYNKGPLCGTLSLNSLLVTVASHTDTTTMTTTNGVYDGPNNTGTFLTSRGAWGAIITKGGDQSNGDAYAPTTSSKTSNSYNPDGYDYIVNLPAGGTVKVFDPGFCAMGGNGAGGSMGTGDHWIGAAGPSNPVSTYYTLWNTNAKPGLRASWTEVYTSNTLFESQSGYDPSNLAPGGGGGAPYTQTNTGCDAYHNAWWTITGGSLMAGTYAVQVQTTKTAHVGASADSSKNQNTSAENMFALEAVGGADGAGHTPQIYGNGKMVVYNNLLGGSPPPVQKFYLAQIDRSTGAGKTALIDLWDIGDISGTGTLRILSPDGGSQNYVNFTYTTDSSCVAVTGAMNCYSSGTASPSVSSIVTTNNGSQATNGTWIHIRVPLPSTYGQSLWNNGWWQVEYTVTQGGNDTTTWQVSVQGNPVHLLMP